MRICWKIFSQQSRRSITRNVMNMKYYNMQHLRQKFQTVNTPRVSSIKVSWAHYTYQVLGIIQIKYIHMFKNIIIPILQFHILTRMQHNTDQTKFNCSIFKNYAKSYLHLKIWWFLCNHFSYVKLTLQLPDLDIWSLPLLGDDILSGVASVLPGATLAAALDLCVQSLSTQTVLCEKYPYKAPALISGFILK
jgi:hypothetical protein